MGSEIDNAEANEAQRKYARLAGCLYLGVIIVALAGGLILSHVAGNGDFDETAKRIAASEHLYRLGLSTVVIASLGSALLAFALYATLKPANNFLALLAMIFCLADSFLALVVRMCGFVRVEFYISSQTDGTGTITAQTLADLMRKIAGATENLGGISFGIGSLLFFYLFFKSAYIPRILAALGVFASVIWIGVYFANLVFPEQHSLFQLICFPPMALAEVITGFYLMVCAVKGEVRGNQAA
jgi:Domain of unknown function (DUF4386)